MWKKMKKNKAVIRVFLKLRDFAKTSDVGLYINLTRGSIRP